MTESVAAAMDAAEWRRCATIIVATLSNAALDPHRGFEQKQAGLIAAKSEPAALRAMVVEMLGWLDALDLSAVQLESLDRQLECAGLPSVGRLRAKLE